MLQHIGQKCIISDSIIRVTWYYIVDLDWTVYYNCNLDPVILSCGRLGYSAKSSSITTNQNRTRIQSAEHLLSDSKPKSLSEIWTRIISYSVDEIIFLAYRWAITEIWIFPGGSQTKQVVVQNRKDQHIFTESL